MCGEESMSMNKKILVSVIVPVYQVEKYLKQCIDSILIQLNDNMELILIDDGSSDSSGGICDQFAQSDTRVVVLHKENGGLMSAWLAGIKIANGEYSVFVDSDDWVEPNMISDFLKIKEKHTPDIICCNFLKEFPDHAVKDIHSVRCGYYTKEQIKKEIYPVLINDGKYLSRGIRICRWAKMIKTDLIRKCVKYCNPKITIGEDLNIMFPLILNSHSIFIMQDAFNYHYRSNSESIMGTCSPNMWKQIIELYITLKFISKEYITEYDFTRQIDRNFSDLILFVANKELLTSTGDFKNIRSLFASYEFEKVEKFLNLQEYGLTRNGLLALCLRTHEIKFLNAYKKLMLGNYHV